MNVVPRKFYITTPIYYVNDRPHIGHVYTTTLVDIVARHHRLCGHDVFFLTGTDEHGKKVADSARQEGLSPQAFADRIAGEFQRTFERMKFTQNDFIRTTEPRHEAKVQQYVHTLQENGDIYLGEYEGWYDEGQEEYVTETNAKNSDYKSPVNGAPLVKVKEKNYFFALSRYRDRLIEHIDGHPTFIQPNERRNEVLSRLRDGIKDVAISRTTETWGIPMPADESHSIYVWIDALFNYLTTIDTDERIRYWPADVHLIGKEILWFHAVIWPAMLMALKQPLYDKLYAHSFWISEGQKMSKSLGNFVDLAKLHRYVDEFGLDALRYFLATQGPMGAADADFSEAKFVDVYNADLANTVGNCLSRIVNMTNRYFDGSLPPVAEDDAGNEMRAQAAPAVESFEKRMTALDMSGAIQAVVGLVRGIDGYIDRTQPFKLAKDAANRPQVGTILYHCAEAMRVASVCLWPVMPEKCEQIWHRLGCDDYAPILADHGRGDFEAWSRWGGLAAGAPIRSGDSLFPRKRVGSERH